jgi:hypothetical protein
MKLLIKIFLGIVLITAGIAVVSARKSGNPAATAVQSSTFYYYPKVNIYYDVARETYIYLGNDGKTWESAKQVTDKLTTGMGKKAVLTNPPLPVWKNNEQHRLVYSTSLYASAKDFKKNPPKAKTRGNQAAVNTEKAEPEKAAKKESGIERFFKRLFKKKSNSDEKDKKQSA